MSINWKEIVVNAGLPLLETVEEEVVDTSLDDYFAKHPDTYKEFLPTAYPVLKQLLVVFGGKKIPAAVLSALIAGIEDSAATNGVELPA